MEDQELGPKILRLISRGRLDDHLTEISETVTHRIRHIRAREAYEQVLRVEAGDRVQIKDAIRPKYLVGKTGTVIKVSNRTRTGVPMVEVDLDNPVGKFSNGKILLHGSSFRILPKEVLRVSSDGKVELHR